MENREIINYPALKIGEKRIIPNSLFIENGSGFLAWRGWQNEQAFNTRGEYLPAYERNFPLSEIESLTPIQSAVIDYLTNGKPANWMFRSLMINLDLKIASFQLEHKSVEKRFLSQTINTEAGFDSMVSDHPEIVAPFAQYAMTTGRANDTELLNAEIL